jgi:acetyl-CoA carboxylase biotin carboxyl carrier protein
MEDRYAEETRTLRELLALMREHDLEELKIKLGDAIFEISRRAAVPSDGPAGPAPATLGEGAAAPDGVAKVLAPLTGVFYRASSPDAQAYVEVGDIVEAGDVICVLEAMKLFNEIQSDYAGTIVRVVPGNGELVSQGEELFWIEPTR